jgi:endonuclease/exonuclease/phosphatase (EEP) superfamily protein YafD
LRQIIEDILHQGGRKLTISGLLLLPALLVIFAPAVYFFKWLVDYSVQVMFAYLVMGFLFLFFSKTYWQTLAWGSCVFLCLFLKYTSNEAFSFDTPSGGRIIKVSNYSISFVEDSIETMVHSILENDAVLVSVQEVTPDIDTLLKSSLKKKYPYFYSLKRADYYGMTIFASYPFEKIDTFNSNVIPNIKGKLRIDGLENGFDFIISYCSPTFSSSMYQTLKDQLKRISEEAKKSTGPVIAMGNYNTVPWGPEVQDFKKIAKLNDSRLGLAPTASSSTNPLFQIPIDHIFHSDQLKCTNFRALSYNQFPHLGVEGTFEILP